MESETFLVWSSKHVIFATRCKSALACLAVTAVVFKNRTFVVGLVKCVRLNESGKEKGGRGDGMGGGMEFFFFGGGGVERMKKREI